jgi:hypothetical protein
MIVVAAWWSHRYAWTYAEWCSVMLHWICPKHKAFVFRRKQFISVLHVLQYYFSDLLQTGCMLSNIFYSVPSFHSIRLELWSNYNVVDSSSVFSSHHWSHSEIPERFPSSPARDRLYWYTIQGVINNFTRLKGVFNVWFFFYPSTNRCHSLWDIVKTSLVFVVESVFENSLLDWGALQIRVRYRDEVVIQQLCKSMQLVWFVKQILTPELI